MIYLDNAATTRPDAEILLKNKDIYGENFFNPSALYRGGLDAKKRIETAREQIAAYFPKDYEIVFTSCGSEADDTAILSFCKRGNFVTTAGEHSAVYQTFKALKARGADVRFAELNENGSVNESNLLSLIDDKTTFVSVVHVNNETGAINDINTLAEKIKALNPSVIFHSDGVQAFGKIPFSLGKCVDLYSISAHKIGGVKGVGALIKRKKLNLTPLIYGGGQESGLRSGTENVFGIAVFGDAAEKKRKNLKDNYEIAKNNKSLFLSLIKDDDLKIITSRNSSPYIVSLSAVGLRGEVILHMLEEKGVIVGTGSACSSRNRYSRVLAACGYDKAVLDGALRISTTAETTEEELRICAEDLLGCVKKLKGVMNG